MPAVSFVKPDGWLDGHPASSKLDLFEGFVKKIVDEVKANAKLWDSTAIIVTFDEGGGYYDSGYIQPLDFFGDGTRIPPLVVSPYTTRRSRLAHLHRSRLDPEIHRTQLAPGSGDQVAAVTTSPIPIATKQQSVRTRKHPSHRRHDGPVLLPLTSSRIGGPAGIGCPISTCGAPRSYVSALLAET